MRKTWEVTDDPPPYTWLAITILYIPYIQTCYFQDVDLDKQQKYQVDLKLSLVDTAWKVRKTRIFLRKVMIIVFSDCGDKW